MGRLTATDLGSTRFFDVVFTIFKVQISSNENGGFEIQDGLVTYSGGEGKGGASSPAARDRLEAGGNRGSRERFTSEI
jgi:hypothetical protein